MDGTAPLRVWVGTGSNIAIASSLFTHLLEGMPGYGPDKVITDKALFTFDNPEREMMLVELAPGETVESVQAAVGWPVRVADEVLEMTPPSAEELAIIREQLDPQGLYR